MDSSKVPRWVVYSCISAIVCALGAGMVPIVSWLYSCELDGTQKEGERRQQGREEVVNTHILNYGLSIGAGAMICNSVYTLLPRDGGWSAFCGFLIGICVSFSVDWVVHRYSRASLVHCGHGRATEEPTAFRDMVEDHGEGTSLLEGVLPLSGYSCGMPAPEAAITGVSIESGSAHCGTGAGIHSAMTAAAIQTPRCRDVVRCLSERRVTVACLENNIGYDLENLATYRDQFMASVEEPESNIIAHMREGEHNHVFSETLDHRHEVATPFSKLLSIGIQTCVVVTLHKFPEGFIIFFTNEVGLGHDGLGFTVFLGLLIHNFIEGFTMTLPLYSALKNKWKSVLITTILSAGSQPVGALIGYLVFRSNNFHEKKPDLTILLSVTAGFLFVLSLQMFQTAVAFSDSHHHHEDDDDRQFEISHSSGIVCLKWCCAGALMVLAGNAFSKHSH